MRFFINFLWVANEHGNKPNVMLPMLWVGSLKLKAEEKMEKEVQEIFDTIDALVAEKQSSDRYWYGTIYLSEEKLQKLFDVGFVCSGRMVKPSTTKEQFLESVKRGTTRSLRSRDNMLVDYRPIYKGHILYPYHDTDIVIL